MLWYNSKWSFYYCLWTYWRVIRYPVTLRFPSPTPNPAINVSATCPSLWPLVEIKAKTESEHLDPVTSTILEHSWLLFCLFFSWLACWNFSLSLSIFLIIAFKKDHAKFYQVIVFERPRVKKGLWFLSFRLVLTNFLQTLSVQVTSPVSSLPLVPTFGRVTDVAAGSVEVNAVTGGAYHIMILPSYHGFLHHHTHRSVLMYHPERFCPTRTIFQQCWR